MKVRERHPVCIVFSSNFISPCFQSNVSNHFFSPVKNKMVLFTTLTLHPCVYVHFFPSHFETCCVMARSRCLARVDRCGNILACCFFFRGSIPLIFPTLSPGQTAGLGWSFALVQLAVRDELCTHQLNSRSHWRQKDPHLIRREQFKFDR